MNSCLKKKENVYIVRKNDYLFYSDYFKNRELKNKSIMVSKSNKSYLIGPLIDAKFYETSFRKRIESNSIYTTKIYKKIFCKKANMLVKKYKPLLKSNQIIEVSKNGQLLLHTIARVPGVEDEKK